jgi:hypothetical protein
LGTGTTFRTWEFGSLAQGVGVDHAVGVLVGVGVAVVVGGLDRIGVSVGVEVEVEVRVADGVAVRVLVAVKAGLGVAVLVPVKEGGVRVMVGVGVGLVGLVNFIQLKFHPPWVI